MSSFAGYFDVSGTAGWVAIGITAITTLLTLSGMAYMLLALAGARQFLRGLRRKKLVEGFAPALTLLKPVKGVDPEMMTAFRSHCTQEYDGEYEIIFGVSSLQDAAVAAVHQLQEEFPARTIRLIECPQRLGANGKVSNLAQMLPHAEHGFVIVNDSDIVVSPKYLAHVMGEFAPARTEGREHKPVGLVTAPYRGCAGRSVWSRLEAMGISTDFFAGVISALRLEGGMNFALGSTLAVKREALEAAGGFAPLVDYLADDYEIGVRVAKSGYSVALCREIVETEVENYSFDGFWQHQLRWLRAMKSSRSAGYFGLMVTYSLPWAMLNCVASGFALWSFSLLSLVLLLRSTVALSIGVGLLRDRQVLRDFWLLPLRDSLALLLWLWSYADDTVLWRGERFRLAKGKLHSIAAKS